ncbi:MAG: heavy-metal-associated domain-containing protein [Bdellovibrionales bacterium]|nr:heavy-metal-associated domain-containing protein [Bdellovibrionales bacterium]
MSLVYTFILCLFFTLPSFATCEDKHDISKNDVNKATPLQPYSKQIHVTGMTCGSCVKNVKSALQAVHLVKGVKFTVDLNLVTIDYSANKKLPKAELTRMIQEAEQAITKAKYKVVKEKV